jgi:hypothetical protein
VPYRQLKQGLLRPEGVAGPLFRNTGPGAPEFGRTLIVRDDALKNVKRALVRLLPDHIVRDLFIPASMEESLDEPDG